MQGRDATNITTLNTVAKTFLLFITIPPTTHKTRYVINLLYQAEDSQHYHYRSGKCGYCSVQREINTQPATIKLWDKCFSGSIIDQAAPMMTELYIRSVIPAKNMIAERHPPMMNRVAL